MFICSCKAVTDRTIKATLAAGARCPEAVSEMCGAGSMCGGCRPAIRKLIEGTVDVRTTDDRATSAA
jgi:bacterioferritin-associated ferredoxin